MRKTLVLLLGVCLLALFVGSVSARDLDGDRYQRTINEPHHYEDPTISGRAAAAAVDTFCMIWWDFETMDWQGFERLDITAQIDTFSHVDDFAGLDGGRHDLLVPIKGAKSLWCGVRPDAGDFYICGFATAPGYGSNWNQIVTTEAFTASGSYVHWSYYIAYDSELNWDFTYAEYDGGTYGWTEIGRYHGIGDVGGEYYEHDIYLSAAQTKLRYHFISDSNTDDYDGKNNTDGGFIVDSITVKDASSTIDYEDFESYDVGLGGHALRAVCFWKPDIEEAFGSFSGLSASLQDKDPCGENFGTQVTFFHGSLYPSSDYPGLWETPFCTGPGAIDLPCQDEAIVSPVIDMTRYSSGCNSVQDTDILEADLNRLGGCVLRVTSYDHMPLDNLVFFTWGVRSIIDGCPQAWKDRQTVYYGDTKTYSSRGYGISDLVGDDPIQVQIGVKDMCYQWYIGPGNCAFHTPAPWIDNIRVYRYKTYGPQWQMQIWDWFQDVFPADGTMEGYCRIDIANDVWPAEATTTYEMGDSCVISVTALLAGGLDTLPNGEDKVYFHCNVEYIGGAPTKPDITGIDLEDDYGEWLYTDGNGWDIFRMDKSRSGESHEIQPDKYMVDLNDTFFTRGYEIEYYFTAWDFNNEESVFPRTAREELGSRGEVTTLPLLMKGNDPIVPGVLFVDDFDGYGGTWEGTEQTYFETAVEAILPAGEPMPDRYDKGAAGSNQSCGIGAFVSADVSTDILCVCYEKIIHASGSLNSYTIDCGDANESGHFNKQDDGGLLVNWLDNSDHDVGLLILGDQVAYDLYTGSAEPSALDLLSTKCGVTLVDREYYQMTGGAAGGVISPKITGLAPVFSGLEYYIDGGCPGINKFAVIEKTDAGEYALQYPNYDGDPYYAGIYTDELNLFNHAMRTVFATHSFYAIQNVTDGPLARIEFLKDVWEFFENGVSETYTDAEVPKVYSLAQNFPNPFNPSTRIQFALPVKGHVSLKIYNVAGQLVKTLQDGVMDAGSHELTWDGSNNLGINVASGVYFYKINAGDNYENMKKMVLLR
jgi:hypothetical protein